MGVVTVYTASRMKQIEDTAVVSGLVVDDNLVLRRRDGVDILAGNVRGPQGYTGPQGERGPEGLQGPMGPGRDDPLLAIALPNATDLNLLQTPGFYYNNGTATNGPGGSGYVTVWKRDGSDEYFQSFQSMLSPYYTFTRSYSASAWTTWSNILLAKTERMFSTISSDKAVSSNWQVVTGWTEVEDTSSSFDPTTGIFTTPSAGWWSYGANLTLGDKATRRIMGISIAGATKHRDEGPQTGPTALCISGERYMAAGTTIRVITYFAAAATATEGITGATSECSFYARKAQN